MTLNEIIPATWRKPLYMVFALVTVALGAIATAYGPENAPEWHAVATNVVLYVGGAFGLVAGANTIADHPITGEEPIEEPDDVDDVPAFEVDDATGEVLSHDEYLAVSEVDVTPPAPGWTAQH